MDIQGRCDGFSETQASMFLFHYPVQAEPAHSHICGLSCLGVGGAVICSMALQPSWPLSLPSTPQPSLLSPGDFPASNFILLFKKDY